MTKVLRVVDKAGKEHDIRAIGFNSGVLSVDQIESVALMHVLEVGVAREGSDATRE